MSVSLLLISLVFAQDDSRILSVPCVTSKCGMQFRKCTNDDLCDDAYRCLMSNERKSLVNLDSDSCVSRVQKLDRTEEHILDCATANSCFDGETVSFMQVNQLDRDGSESAEDGDTLSFQDVEDVDDKFTRSYKEKVDGAERSFEERMKEVVDSPPINFHKIIRDAEKAADIEYAHEHKHKHSSLIALDPPPIASASSRSTSVDFNGLNAARNRAANELTNTVDTRNRDQSESAADAFIAQAHRENMATIAKGKEIKKSANLIQTDPTVVIKGSEPLPKKEEKREKKKHEKRPSFLQRDSPSSPSDATSAASAGDASSESSSSDAAGPSDSSSSDASSASESSSSDTSSARDSSSKADASGDANTSAAVASSAVDPADKKASSGSKESSDNVSANETKVDKAEALVDSNLASLKQIWDGIVAQISKLQNTPQSDSLKKSKEAKLAELEAAIKKEEQSQQTAQQGDQTQMSSAEEQVANALG